MTAEEIKALERQSGMYKQVYILDLEATGEKSIDLIEGQTSLDENWTNNLTETTPVKVEAYSETEDVQWTSRTGGLHDFTCSVGFEGMKAPKKRVITTTFLTKMKTQRDSAVIALIGNTTDTAGTLSFTGTAYHMLTGSVSMSSPSNANMTGTIELSNSGQMKPIDYTDESLASIIAELTGVDAGA